MPIVQSRQSFGKDKLKAGGTHTPTHSLATTQPTCAQQYHPCSGSNGQLFCPYWGSSARHSRQTSVWTISQCLQRLFTGEASAKHSFKHQFHTRHMGAELAGNCTAVLPQHACWGRGIRSYHNLCASKFNIRQT